MTVNVLSFETEVVKHDGPDWTIRLTLVLSDESVVHLAVPRDVVAKLYGTMSAGYGVPESTDTARNSEFWSAQAQAASAGRPDLVDLMLIRIESTAVLRSGEQTVGLTILTDIQGAEAGLRFDQCAVYFLWEDFYQAMQRPG